METFWKSLRFAGTPARIKQKQPDLKVFSGSPQFN
jgi:hypothetical protein